MILVLPDRSVPSLVAELLSKLFMKHVYLPIHQTIDRSIDQIMTHLEIRKAGLSGYFKLKIRVVSSGVT